eukprot:6190967-Pleurochrysis_carterae.AAC.2
MGMHVRARDGALSSCVRDSGLAQAGREVPVEACLCEAHETHSVHSIRLILFTALDSGKRAASIDACFTSGFDTCAHGVPRC